MTYPATYLVFRLTGQDFDKSSPIRTTEWPVNVFSVLTGWAEGLGSGNISPA
jgi:hypothetical protein